MSGHTSCAVMTAGSFISLPGSGPLFASADEATCKPAVWDVASRTMLPVCGAFESPVVQLAGGSGVIGGSQVTLLGACSSSCLRLHMAVGASGAEEW